MLKIIEEKEGLWLDFNEVFYGFVFFKNNEISVLEKMDFDLWKINIVDFFFDSI